MPWVKNITTRPPAKYSVESLKSCYQIIQCCAQFTVTRGAIRQRHKEDYIRFRDWLLETPLQDELSGRFFEYSWHSECLIDVAAWKLTKIDFHLVIFGKKNPLYRPSAAYCYCKLYGMCEFEDCSDDDCKEQYSLPVYSTLPPGWPPVGWDGEERIFNGPLQ